MIKIDSLLGKILEIIGKFFTVFFNYLFELFGWRGFLFRVFFSLLLFELSSVGMPKYNMGTSGGKLLLISGGLFIYAVGKLIYDYTKAGKE